MAPLPPLLVYIGQRLPLFIIPSAVVWGFLTALSRHFLLSPIPTWLVVLATISARPGLFFFSRWMKPIVDARAARVVGAVPPPRWNESLLAILKQLETLIAGYPSDLLTRLEAKYGPTFLFTLISDDTVSTSEPEHIKAMLATQFDNFEKGLTSFEQMKSLLGNGIFNVDGDMWKFHRSMARPFFTKERISDFEIYERNSSQSLSIIRERVNEGVSFDFQDLVARFTLDSATEFLFGLNINSLFAGLAYPPSSSKSTPSTFLNHKSNVFLHAFTAAVNQITFRSGFGSDWPLFEPTGDKVFPMRKVIEQFVEPIMDNAFRKVEECKLGEKKAKDEDPVSLLEYLATQTQDRTIIQDELINLLVAGRDTTASLMTFCVYMLCRHPEIEKRLRDEIFAVVGPKDSPTYEQMRGMKYMRAFLNEVLRLYPPVPIDGRETKHDVVLTSKNPNSQPYYVSRGTMCIYSVMVMHRRTDLWGPDAEVFDPDRFIDNRVHKYLTPNPYIFLPFNAGPRICLGQQFAYHETTFFMTKLLQHFTAFKLDKETNVKAPKHWKAKGGIQGSEEIFPKANFTLYVDGGLWVYMKEYKGTGENEAL